MRLVVLGACLAGLAGCETLPPEAYVAASASGIVRGDPVGRNASNEECFAAASGAVPADLPVRRSREVVCRGWTQAAARVEELEGPSGVAQLDAIAAGGVWRGWLDKRFACAAPRPISLPGGRAARILDCTRRIGGWNHVALVGEGRGGPVVADGLATTLPLMMALIEGARSSDGSPQSRTALLEASLARISRSAYSAADLGKYEDAMALGRELNQLEKYAGAEEAYRAALAIQERVLGRDDPNTATPLMHLALNLSNQGRHTDARPLFARAEALAPRSADPVARARLLHYRGLDALSSGQPAVAAQLLEQAERAYAALAPADAATMQADGLGGVVVDPVGQSAFLGMIEARRNRAVALARGGHPDEAEALANSTQGMLRSANLDASMLIGRGLRTTAGATQGAGRQSDSISLLRRAASRFGQGAPGERPEATTLFLVGGRLAAAGSPDDALEAFRAGARVLHARQLALAPELIIGYLDVLAAEAARTPDRAQALWSEMFDVAQLAQRPHTTQLVAQAAARLGSSGGDSRIAQSVRVLQDSERELRSLFDQRDTTDAASAAAMDARIAAAQTKREEAEEQVAAKAPGYRQLIQASAEAPAVAKVLRPHDALVTMVIGHDHGYAFAVRPDGRVQAARIASSDAQIAALVRRVRETIEPADGATPTTFDTAAAYSLYQAVLAPVLPDPRGIDTLLVTPDGPLLALPMGLLLTGVADPARLQAAPWLIRRHEVIHVPSPQTLISLRSAKPANGPARSYVGFGNPSPPNRAQLARTFPAERCGNDARLAAQLGPLPGTPLELDSARRAAGAGPGSVHMGPAFTAKTLLAADLQDYRVVHLATHALLPGELSCLREPTLVVSTAPGSPDARDAFVPASRLFDLKLDADLVVLSACNTGGNGGEASGESLTGLARSFFYAGARGLLVTHWAVNDQSAAALISKLLEREQAEGTATALRSVQLEFIDNAGTRYPAVLAHPYHWAAFALIGQGSIARGAAQVGALTTGTESGARGGPSRL